MLSKLPRGTQATAGVVIRIRRFWFSNSIFAVFIASLYLSAPFWMSNYALTVIVTLAFIGILAISWNILASTGQISLGQAAFVGVGAYTTAILVPKSGIAVSLLGILVAGLCASVLGGVIAAATVRMARWVFAIVTLAVAETLRVVADEAEWLTNGALGVFSRNAIGIERERTVWVAGGLLAVAFTISLMLRYSRLHYYFSAIRLDPEAASMCGISVKVSRIISALISGFIAGLAGGFYSLYVGYINPANAFSLQFSVDAQVMPIVGGIYTTTGPVAGTFLVGGVQELARAEFGATGLIISGMLLVVFVLYLPTGIVGRLEVSLRRLRMWRLGSGRGQ